MPNTDGDRPRCRLVSEDRSRKAFRPAGARPSPFPWRRATKMGTVSKVVPLEAQRLCRGRPGQRKPRPSRRIVAAVGSQVGCPSAEPTPASTPPSPTGPPAQIQKTSFANIRTSLAMQGRSAGGRRTGWGGGRLNYGTRAPNRHQGPWASRTIGAESQDFWAHVFLAQLQDAFSVEGGCRRARIRTPRQNVSDAPGACNTASQAPRVWPRRRPPLCGEGPPETGRPSKTLA